MSNAKQVKSVEPLINGLPGVGAGTFQTGDGVNLFSNESPYDSRYFSKYTDYAGRS